MQRCTYDQTYPCSSRDSKGQTTWTICTRNVTGHQDAVWEKVTFYNSYRILFDGQDLVNVAVFRANGQQQVEERELQHDSCR